MEAMLETTSELRVRYAETDQMGLVYHTNYLVWCEIGRTDWLRQAGARYADLERQGIYLALSGARIRFLAAASYDDPIRVRTRLTRVRSRDVRFSYVVEHAETMQPLVRAETDLICLDASGSPRQLPSELDELLRRATDGSAPTGTTGRLQGVANTNARR
ncbi:MAG: thioesterase family protein [Gemmatimonadota bacterium]